MSAIDLKQQLLDRVAILRRAGLEYVPKAPPAPVRTPAADVAEAENPNRVALDMLEREVASCRLCKGLFATRSATVFGTGPLEPDILFLADVPDQADEKAGHPFAGELGELLDRMLGRMGYGRDEVYLTTLLKCATPRRRAPKPEEASNCLGHLTKQLEAVRPKAICCFGAASARVLLDSEAELANLRAESHRWNGIPVVVTFDLSHLLEQPNRRRDCWQDLLALLGLLGRTPPG